jgi:hypothetical protein
MIRCIENMANVEDLFKDWHKNRLGLTEAGYPVMTSESNIGRWMAFGPERIRARIGVLLETSGVKIRG